MPFFSVIIPLYNKESHITGTLQSALKQSFTDFEIIVVDDGSTDNSSKLVNNINDSRILYHKTKNSGVSAARNKGISLSSGEVIAFLDADDYWEPNHLSVLYQLYKENPSAGMLTSRYTVRVGRGVLIKPFFQGISDTYSGIVKDFFYSSLVYRVALTAAVAVPKKVFKVTGTFNENITHPEDTELWIKIAIKFPVAISNQFTMVYNFDLPESWSRQKMKNRKVMDFNQFLEEETHNESLKDFIDVYRVEYAMKYRIEGDLKNFKKLYKAANPKKIHYKTKILFNTPPFILRSFLKIKHWLHKKGITFSIYN